MLRSLNFLPLRLGSALRLAAAFAAAAGILFSTAAAAAGGSVSASRLRVSVPESFSPELSGAAGSEFAALKKKGAEPAGTKLDLAFGSAVAVQESLGGGKFRLLAATNGGPTCDGPLLHAGGRSEPTRIYLLPDYSPAFVELALDLGAGTLTATGIRRALKNGEDYVGIPPKTAGSLTLDYRETPVSLSLKTVRPLRPPLSPLGIAVTGNGSVWVADGTLPSLLRLSAKGLGEVQRVVPGKGLPRFLALGALQLGFQSLAALPGGRLATVLYPDAHPEYAVILVSRPSDWTSEAYVYPRPSGFRRFRLRGLAASPKGALFAVEEGEGKGGRRFSRLTRFTFRGADDMTMSPAASGSFPDTTLSHLLAEGLRPIRPAVLADLGKLGITGTVSSLAVLDPRTILAATDSAYGVRCTAGATASPASLELSEKRKLFRNGKPLPDSEQMVRLRPSGARTEAWVLRSPKPF